MPKNISTADFRAVPGRRGVREKVRQRVIAAWFELDAKKATARKVAELTGVSLPTVKKHKPPFVKDWTGDPSLPKPARKKSNQPSLRTHNYHVVQYLKTLPKVTIREAAEKMETGEGSIRYARKYVPEWEPLPPKGRIQAKKKKRKTEAEMPRSVAAPKLRPRNSASPTPSDLVRNTGVSLDWADSLDRLAAAVGEMRLRGQQWDADRLMRMALVPVSWEYRTALVKLMMGVPAHVLAKNPPVAPPTAPATVAQDEAEKPARAGKIAIAAKATKEGRSATGGKAKAKASKSTTPKSMRRPRKASHQVVAAPADVDEPVVLVERDAPPGTVAKKRKSGPTGKSGLVVRDWLANKNLTAKQLARIHGVDKRTAEEALHRWTDWGGWSK